MSKDQNDYFYAGSTFAAYLTAAFNRPETPVHLVAHEIGHPNPRFLASVARGERRFALDMVPELARALGADPLHILAMSMRDYSVGLADVLDVYCMAMPKADGSD